MNSIKSLITVALVIIYPILVGYGVNIVVPEPTRHAYVTTHHEPRSFWRSIAHGQNENNRRNDYQRHQYHQAYAHYTVVKYFWYMLIGVLSLIACLFIRDKAISTGLSIGSGIILLFSYLFSWWALSQVPRFFALLFVMLFLIILSMAISRKEKKKKQPQAPTDPQQGP